MRKNCTYFVIRFLLPRFHLLNDVVTEILLDPEMKIAQPFRLDEDTFPGSLSGSIFRPLLDLVVPIFRPILQCFRVTLLDLRSFLDQSYQAVAQFVPVLDPLGRSFVITRLPERVRGCYQHVVVAVM